VDVTRTLKAEFQGDARIVWSYLFGSAVRGGTFRDVDVERARRRFARAWGATAE
jgi:hypothetical protein